MLIPFVFLMVCIFLVVVCGVTVLLGIMWETNNNATIRAVLCTIASLMASVAIYAVWTYKFIPAQ